MVVLTWGGRALIDNDVRDNYTSLLLGGTATNRPNFHLELKLGGGGKGRWSRAAR